MHIIDRGAAGSSPPQEMLASSVGDVISSITPVDPRHAASSVHVAMWLTQLHRLGLPAALIDSFGRVVAHNDAAGVLNGRYFILQQGRLRLFSPRQPRKSESVGHILLTEGIATPRRTHLLLTAEDGTHCVASLCPVSTDDAVHGLTMLIFRTANTATRSLWRMLIDDLGLSFAETRVVIELHKTCDLSETAQSLGLSKETVRTQLKAAFSKLGVGKQSELVLRVEQLLSLQL